MQYSMSKAKKLSFRRIAMIEIEGSKVQVIDVEIVDGIRERLGNTLRAEFLQLEIFDIPLL